MPAKVQSSTTLSGTCGVGLFHNYSSYDYWRDRSIEKHAPPRGGCGWNIAGFIRNNESKEVYEDLKSMYKIVMQSPTRRNNNSGNTFFFIVYDCKKPRRSKNNPEGKYDLSNNDKYSWPWK